MNAGLLILFLGTKCASLLACRVMQPAPCVTFSGSLGSLAVHVVWNGRCSTHGVDNVGTVPAALSTYLAIQVRNVDAQVNAHSCQYTLTVWSHASLLLVLCNIVHVLLSVMLNLFHTLAIAGLQA